MLKWLYRIGFAWQAEARGRRRRVDRRLRAEVAEARVQPSPDLRGRTIAALNDATHAPTHASSRDILPRPAAPAYLLGLLILVVLGVLAVRVGITEPAAPVAVVKRPAMLANFDTTEFDALIRTRLQEFEGTWESSLRTEAKLLANDARNAGEFLLASLPLPATWGGLSRPGG